MNACSYRPIRPRHGHRAGEYCLSNKTPEDSNTYLHHLTRAVRFGTKVLAIMFLSGENDAGILNDVQDHFEVNVSEALDEVNIYS